MLIEQVLALEIGITIFWIHNGDISDSNKRWDHATGSKRLFEPDTFHEFLSISLCSESRRNEIAEMLCAHYSMVMVGTGMINFTPLDRARANFSRHSALKFQAHKTT